MAHSRFLHRSMVVGVLLFSGALPALQAQLTGRSPFLPPAEVQAEAPAPTKLEYLGFMQTPEGVFYRVRDGESRQAAFMRLGESDAEMQIRARHFDPATDTLTVERAGQTWTLAERKGRIQSAGSAAPSGLVRPAVSPAVIQTVHVNPTPQQEVERLNAIALEVKTRREQREREFQNAVKR